jgi:hypothetical protein
MNEVFKTTRTQAFEVDLPKFVPAPEELAVMALPTLTFPDKVVLSRSPFFVSETPYVPFDEIRANLYIYRGIKTQINQLYRTSLYLKSSVSITNYNII